VVETVIGVGAPTKEGTSAAHSEPLGAEEARAAKRSYGWWALFGEQDSAYRDLVLPPAVTARGGRGTSGDPGLGTLDR
jgi:transketolase